MKDITNIMKQIFILLVATSSFLACKKTTTSNTNFTTCVDNPNINFSSKGTPIGKFSDCIKDIDGNVYKTVNIGNQTWMTENLKVTKYNDGTSIPTEKDKVQWSKLTTGAWCNYNNNDSLGNIYGKLYNWYAVSPTTNSNKNLCPTGWHVPSDTEWNVLTDYLGGGNVAGGKMKEVGTANWINSNTEATNTSLFTGLPGGGRYTNGNYYDTGLYGYWWCSSENRTYDVWIRYLDFVEGIANRSYEYKEGGLSVRCLKD